MIKNYHHAVQFISSYMLYDLNKFVAILSFDIRSGKTSLILKVLR